MIKEVAKSVTTAVDLWGRTAQYSALKLAMDTGIREVHSCRELPMMGNGWPS